MLGKTLSVWVALTYVTSLNAQTVDVEKYLLDPNYERQLAHSAGPDHVADKASIWLWTKKGYQISKHGDNGFNCIVMRAFSTESMGFTSNLDPKMLAPVCFNQGASEFILPVVLKKGDWAAKGWNEQQFINGMKESYINGTFRLPNTLSIGYMLSEHQYLNAKVKNGMPHMMLYSAYTNDLEWGGHAFNSDYPFVLADDTPVTVSIIPLKKFNRL